MFELLIILSRYLFLFYIIFFLWQSIVYTLHEREVIASSSKTILKQKVIIVIMHITAFLILSYSSDKVSFNVESLLMGLAGLIFLLFAFFTSEKIFKNSCQVIWNSVFFLMDVSLIMLQRLNPSLSKKQLIWFFVGYSITLIIPIFIKLVPKFEILEKAYLILGITLIILPFIFGKIQHGSLNWIVIGNFSFQPSEAVKFLYIFYLACVFRKRLTVGRFIFSSLVAACFVCILVAQKDLGGALVFFMTYMVMMYIATGSELFFITGMGFASFAAFMSYKVFSHIKVRVAAWQNPFKDVDTGGYQIVQSLFAIGTWGLLGSGLTRGLPKFVPVVETDFIFAAICEEFGTLFGILFIGVFVVIFFRGFIISLRCKRRFYSLISVGIVSMLSFQTFLILGGVIKLIPLTGVTLPLVSYGGSSCIVSILMIGLIQWIFIYNHNMEVEEHG